MNSAIFQGWVRHRRHGEQANDFTYKVFMPFLRLDELPDLFDGVPFWSARRPALAWFRRADFLGDPDVPLDTAVRDRVEEKWGKRPSGPIFLLANLRYFGYQINPIACYYCYAEDGETLEYVVAEVTNTPWEERHSYVLATQPGERRLRARFDKAMHVSPFQPLDMQYRWQSNLPEEQLTVFLACERDGECVFDASLKLQRQPASRRQLLHHIARYPFMTAKVGLGIYWQALKLWWRGARFYPNPNSNHRTASTSHE